MQRCWSTRESKSQMSGKSTYTPEQAQAICEELASGKSLRQICSEDGFPTVQCVMKWLAQQPAFVEQYARAREQQTETWANEINDIADAATPEDFQVAKLRVDTRKWLLSKLAPKKYGDRLDVTGAVGLNIERIILTAPPLPPMNRPALLPAFSDGDVIDAETE